MAMWLLPLVRDRLGQQALKSKAMPRLEGAGRTVVSKIAKQRRSALNTPKVRGCAGNYAARLLGVHPNYLHRLLRNLDLRARVGPGRSTGAGNRTE